MNESVQSAEIKQRVKEILRRDLKMGPDARIDDETPLFNSDADLDSLDMLLLVSSIEREFGFRIPNEAVGETVFQSVKSLAGYIEKNRSNGTPSRVKEIETGASLLDRLPHGPGFRFVSAVHQVKMGESAEGAWRLTGKESFFADHFPGNPIVPGVLIGEALAQLSGLIVGESGQRGSLAQMDIRFEKSVAPPAEIILQSKLRHHLGALWQFQVLASVGENRVAQGTVALHISAGEVA